MQADHRASNRPIHRQNTGPKAGQYSSYRNSIKNVSIRQRLASEGPRAQKLLLRFSAFQKGTEPKNRCCASAHFRRAPSPTTDFYVVALQRISEGLRAQKRISMLLRFSAFQKDSEPKNCCCASAHFRRAEAQQRISVLLRFSAFRKDPEPNNGGLKIYRLIWFGKSGTKRANLATLYFRERLAISSFFQ